MCLLQVLAGLVGSVIQLVAILTKHDLGDLVRAPLGAASPCLAVLVLLVSGMLVPALAPRWFERHRVPLFAASRLLYFSLPTVQSPRGYSYILQARCPGPLLQCVVRVRCVYALSVQWPAACSRCVARPGGARRLATCALAAERPVSACCCCWLPLPGHGCPPTRLLVLHRCRACPATAGSASCETSGSSR